MIVKQGAFAVGLALCGLSACSAPVGDPEAIDSASEQVLGAAGSSATVWNLSVGTSDSWESETAGLSLSGIDHFAWNAEDRSTAHVSYITRAEKDASGRPYVDRVVCPGTSQMMRAVYDPVNTPVGDDPWTYSRLPVPASWAVMWGDPAIAYSDGKMWVSALGSPTSFWNTITNYTKNGVACYRTSDYAGSGLPDSFEDALAGACVQGTTLGTTGSGLVQSCFRRSNGVVSSTGNDFFDGGSGATSSDAMYFAYQNMTTQSLAMYKLARGGAVPWAVVSGDRSIRSNFHPLVLADVSFPEVWVITYESTSSKLILRKHSSAGWSSPSTIASGVWLKDVTLKGGAGAVRGRNYSALMMVDGNGEVAKILVAYQTMDGIYARVTFSLCDVDTLACTSAGFVGGNAKRENAFMPSMATAHPLVSGAYNTVTAITYWSDQGFADGSVVLRSFGVNLAGASTAVSTLTAAQKPCPGAANYWGDYDAMFVKNDFSSAPVFYRPFSDSTMLTCDRTTRANLDFDNQDQHVSLAFWPSPKQVL